MITHLGRLLAVWLTASNLAGAGVVVLANRSDAEVHAAVGSPDATSRQFQIAAGDAVPVSVAGEVSVSFDDGGGQRQYVLETNSVYYFTRQDGKLDLHQVTFSPDRTDRVPEAEADATDSRRLSPALGGVESFLRMGVVPVMVLVDDEERAARHVWQKRLCRRVEAASDVIDRYCGLRFRVVATGTWDSDDDVQDFSKALREFEVEVIPAPATLAIGFTSQYKVPKAGRCHLGGTRGPLRPHLLIQEGPPGVSQAERLEVLVHELGHYLGSVHSADPDSVMRPILGDGRARSRDFPLRFDAVNTLIMSLVGEEIRTRRIRTLSQLSPGVKEKLWTIFAAVARASPGDTVATTHSIMLEATPRIIPPLITEPGPLVRATRTVVEAIVEAAETNCRKPTGSAATPQAGTRLEADQLTEFYFRRAASGASSIPAELAQKAYLLGLAVAVDDSSLLRDSPLVGGFCRQVESDSERKHRLEVLGSPTMCRRRDLAQHFVVSCGLTVLVGSGATEAVGISKELLDSQFRGGFSFADLMADVSGVMFAEQVGDGRVTLASLAESFRVGDFLPGHEDLLENVSWKQFVRSYGSTQDDRFAREMTTIRERIQTLPGYGRAP